MDNQRGNFKPPIIETGVGDLPAGLLGRTLIQHLPWGKRVQVEGVCTSWRKEARAYGWEDMKHLAWGETNGSVRLRPTSWFPLLARTGRHLTTLDLHEVDGLSEDELLAGLVECRKLKHLCVCWEQLTPPVLDHICRAYAPVLKSLLLFAEGLDDRETATAFNEALGRVPSLEYLRVDDWVLEASRLRFRPAAASQLGNLRHLALWDCKISQDSFDTLATLPSLRSLTLREVGVVKNINLSTLQHFPCIEYLCIRVNTSNVASFITALPHLGTSLKALEVNVWLSISVIRQLIPPISTHLHLLEHLDLSVEKPGQQEEMSEMEQLLGSLASPRLNGLRSLSLWAVEPAGWGWLERICQEHQQMLEYLELYKAPPLATLCCVVRKCKKLSGIKLENSPPWDTADVVKLAEAVSAAATDGSMNENEEGQCKNFPFPTLCIAFEDDRMVQKLQTTSNSSQLRFLSGEDLESQVLEKHKFGCLSEGSPAFTSVT